MNNKVELSDDELSLVVTSLLMTISGYEKYIQENRESNLDIQTKEVIKDTKILYERLNKEYF